MGVGRGMDVPGGSLCNVIQIKPLTQGDMVTVYRVPPGRGKEFKQELRGQVRRPTPLSAALGRRSS